MTIKILAIGEALGRQEDLIKRPFVGAAGHTLNQLMEDAEILPPGSTRAISPHFSRDPAPSQLLAEADRRDAIYAAAGIHLTNVFNLRPDGNKIERLCGPRWGDLPPIRAGKYIRPEFTPHLERLAREIEEHRPNLILALGGIACWFALRSAAITKRRGTIAYSKYGKVLPTFHPASLLMGRSPENRPIVLMDLIKAKAQCEFPEIRRPQRFVFIPETIQDIHWGIRELRAAPIISIDIETVEDQITSISFAWSLTQTLAIPIFDWNNDACSYWGASEEYEVWRLINLICSLPNPKLFQNGLYDIRFLWNSYGIQVVNCEHDLMLLHHARQPEMQKGLAFQGSIYTDEPAWKLDRPRGKGTIKREDE